MRELILNYVVTVFTSCCRFWKRSIHGFRCTGYPSCPRFRPRPVHPPLQGNYYMYHAHVLFLSLPLLSAVLKLDVKFSFIFNYIHVYDYLYIRFFIVLVLHDNPSYLTHNLSLCLSMRVGWFEHAKSAWAQLCSAEQVFLQTVPRSCVCAWHPTSACCAVW